MVHDFSTNQLQLILPQLAFAWLPLLSLLPSAIGAISKLGKQDSSDSDKVSGLADLGKAAAGAYGGQRAEDGAIDSLLGAWRSDRGGGDISDDDLLNASPRYR